MWYFLGMMYSNALCYVYVAPPKTGSMSMRGWLRKNYGGQEAGYKYHQIPEEGEFEEHFRFITVRHPYARCFSWWHWETRIGSRFCELVGLDEVPGLMEYLELVRTWSREGAPEGLDHPYMYISQAEYFRRSRAELALRLEERPGDLIRLPFVNDIHPTFPRQRKGKYTGTLPDEAKPLVREIYGEDFPAFGYTP